MRQLEGCVTSPARPLAFKQCLTIPVKVQIDQKTAIALIICSWSTLWSRVKSLLWTRMTSIIKALSTLRFKQYISIRLLYAVVVSATGAGVFYDCQIFLLQTFANHVASLMLLYKLNVSYHVNRECMHICATLSVTELNSSLITLFAQQGWIEIP